MKIGVCLKWVFVFLVLGVWTFFVISGASSSYSNSVYASDSNAQIYSQTLAGFERLTFSNLIDTLFNYNFSLIQKTEIIPVEDCSLRAKGGNFEANELSFQNNKLNFYVPVKNAAKGSGYLTGQAGRTRISIQFDVINIIKTNANNLIVNAKGIINLDRNITDLDSITINLDKLNNKVYVSIGSPYEDDDGDIDYIMASNMDVSFMKGCNMEERSIYLLNATEKLEKRRTIKEVRTLLDSYPQFIDSYGNLRDLYKQFWWMSLPGGMGIVS